MTGTTHREVQPDPADVAVCPADGVGAGVGDGGVGAGVQVGVVLAGGAAARFGH